MASANGLDIYNDTRKLIEDYIRVYEKIKVMHRHYIGKYMYDRILELPMCIILANKAFDDKHERIQHIQKYIEIVECVSNTLRIAGETEIISVTDHNKLSKQIKNLLMQANAWKKKTARIPDTDSVRGEMPPIKGYPVETAKQTTYE